ncbi:NAD(P)H-hydrate dehydratase [Botrimarina hoheduenensis]|uniref:ADP-dependent (S)-NAD(P)H-hydrate dehydratase n=1 Tax=Botrimarina hoheduenensis TaxID=2528000 RepID=A0A5C5VY63_9BACT|nr:NAD(P)H-hydrate dehydratase [Botrimarina hoheduenensis]TWT43364.1 ATP-dependent (S)-NAD(P)H-hydrate dehydratase [Botrimarina hoheduenensis]
MIDVTDTELPLLPARDPFGHKGDYGRGLVVGGSLGMAGAPALSAMACLASGAGLVAVATPRCVLSTVAGYCPAYTTHPLADDGEQLVAEARTALDQLLSEADAAAMGPGIGRGDAINDLLERAWTESLPAVIDADGLNALAARRSFLGTPGGPRVLTPHAKEFARLRGQPLDNPNHDAQRLEAAAELARSLGGPETVVLLKGARTVVTNGHRYAVNSTGNPGMATGGVGDVLTGVILALLCQGMAAFDAARLAAHVHGLAGDLAAAKLGQLSVTAPALIEALPAAWRTVSS